MKRAVRIIFILSAVCFCLFLLGISEPGQVLLRGKIPPDATHWERDDIYMGAGLAPWVYGLGSSLLLAVVGGVLLGVSKVKSKRHS